MPRLQLPGHLVGLYQGTTIRRHELLRAYPNMGNNLRINQPNLGRMKYGDLAVQFEKRMTKGFKTSIMYTYANSTCRTGWRTNSTPSRPGDRTTTHAAPPGLDGDL